jgi:protein phosphatase
VNVGDSRAYWLTPRYCHLLTVDDDVASRDVWMGRSLYREALARNDAGALVQAIGTREGEALRPTVQRFILEEDGLLLLCSDGLSDGDRIEQAWEETTRLVLKGNMSLEAAVQSWVNLANQLNGHDNTSVVILHCQISPENLQLFVPGEPTQPPIQPIESELSASARALLYDEEPAPTSAPTTATPSSPRTKSSATLNLWALTLGIAVLMFVLGALGITAWRQINPQGFQRTFERLFAPAPPQPTQPPTTNP